MRTGDVTPTPSRSTTSPAPRSLRNGRSPGHQRRRLSRCRHTSTGSNRSGWGVEPSRSRAPSRKAAAQPPSAPSAGSTVAATSARWRGWSGSVAAQAWHPGRTWVQHGERCSARVTPASRSVLLRCAPARSRCGRSSTRRACRACGVPARAPPSAVDDDPATRPVDDAACAPDHRPPRAAPGRRVETPAETRRRVSAGVSTSRGRQPTAAPTAPTAPTAKRLPSGATLAP